MNLAEIFTALPLSTTNVLEQYLEKIKVSVNPTREEIHEAASVATRATLEELGEVPEEQSEILKQVPDAVIAHLGL